MEEPQKTKALEELSAVIDDYVKHISLMTNSNCNIDNLLLEKISAIKVIMSATNSTPPPKDITINYVIPEYDYCIYVDMYYMEAAISNILKNAYDAISEKKEPGVVTIKLFSEFDSVVIAISDTGSGIDKRIISHMFKPFYTTKSRVLNWGIGLSFTKRIIRMHDGHITVHSKKNEGTEFSIILPMS